MKKLVTIIVVLLIALVGIIGYQKSTVKQEEIKIEEIEAIEKYIHQIYMWREITEESLPCFEDINQANENWIWEVVKKNVEEYEFTYEEIQQKAKEMFGENFHKDFPKEGTEYIFLDEEKQQYFAVGMGMDKEEEAFLLSKIEKIKDGYEVEIIEYLEDYSLVTEDQDTIIIKNLTGEEMGRMAEKEEEKAKELVKENKDRFSKKKIILKAQNEKLYVKRVYQE